MPLIRYVDRANRALQNDMVDQAHRSGYTEITYAHNAVFSTLQAEGSRASDMAATAGITRQSMGEIVRGMVALGIVEMRPDPDDGRAKLVVYTPRGLEMVREGFQHIIDLEKRFADEFGDDYETARKVLDRVVTILAEPDDA
ncbi:MAG: MarR family winged helix-turn-helix transcriptional regulator [Marmoricola sp.]